jgi:hypothetical protein
MGKRLRLGIVGLGPRWQTRFEPALAATRDRFSIKAVYDPLTSRARQAARRLDCPLAVGLSALLDSDQVDVVILPDPAWFGLWPAEQALRRGKRCVCGSPSALEDPAIERLADQSGLLLPDLPRHTAIFEAVQTELNGRLGPARLVTATVTSRRFGGAGAIRAVDGCFAILGGEPQNSRRILDHPTAGRQTIFEWSDGRAAIVRERQTSPGTVSGLNWQLDCLKGTAKVSGSRRLRVSLPDGRSSKCFPRSPVTESAALERLISGFVDDALVAAVARRWLATEATERIDGVPLPERSVP